MRAPALGLLLCVCCTWIEDNPAFVADGSSSSTASGSASCGDSDEPNDALAQAVEIAAPEVNGPPSSVASSLGPDDIDWFAFDTELVSGHRYSASASNQLCTCLVPRCVDGLIEDLPGCRGRMSPEGYEDELDGYIACCGASSAIVPEIAIECSVGTRARIHVVVVGGMLAAQNCGDQFVPPDACVPYELGYQHSSQ